MVCMDLGICSDVQKVKTLLLHQITILFSAMYTNNTAWLNTNNSARDIASNK